MNPALDRDVADRCLAEEYAIGALDVLTDRDAVVVPGLSQSRRAADREHVVPIRPCRTDGQRRCGLQAADAVQRNDDVERHVRCRRSRHQIVDARLGAINARNAACEIDANVVGVRRDCQKY